MAARLGLAASFGAAVLGGSAGPFPAFGQQEASHEIRLSGVIPQSCTVAAAPEATATMLPLAEDHSTRTTAVKVATITETCNHPDGYTIQIESGNAVADSSAQAHLALAGSDDVVDYRLLYQGGIEATLVNGRGSVKDVDTQTDLDGFDADLAVMSSPAVDITLDPGASRDMIKVIMAGKWGGAVSRTRARAGNRRATPSRRGGGWRRSSKARGPPERRPAAGRGRAALPGAAVPAAEAG